MDVPVKKTTTKNQASKQDICGCTVITCCGLEMSYSFDLLSLINMHGSSLSFPSQGWIQGLGILDPSAFSSFPPQSL